MVARAYVQAAWLVPGRPWRTAFGQRPGTQGHYAFRSRREGEFLRDPRQRLPQRDRRGLVAPAQTRPKRTDIRGAANVDPETRARPGSGAPAHGGSDRYGGP